MKSECIDEINARSWPTNLFHLKSSFARVKVMQPSSFAQ